MPNKTYLGDSVYGEQTLHDLILTTNNGEENTNIIFLGPSEVQRLIIWFRSIGIKFPKEEG